MNFWNINDSVCHFCNFCVAFFCNRNHFCSPCLYFFYIADQFFIQCILCCNGNHQCTIFNQRYCAMFQFTRSICFTMDIRNFFQFQRTFHRHRIVNATSNKKYIICKCISFCQFFPLHFVFQQFFHIFRDLFQFSNQCLQHIIRNITSCMPQFQCQ